MSHKPFALAALLAASCTVQAASDADLAAIRSQINEIKQSYEQRIAALEQKLAQAESKASKAETTATKAETTASKAEVVANEARLNVRQPQTSASAFNPEISLILSGSYTNLKQNPSERRLQGFIPSNGELMPENRSFNLGESELVIAANIDPMFRGTLRLALAPDNTLGVEEASVQTLGLGNGFNLKAGRFLSGVGYLNELHPHEWDFSNAPLPYQTFFGNALGMDGVQARWLAPTPIFLEFGAETARAMSFPSTDETKSKNGLMSATAFVHLGGDLGVSNSWRGGISYFASQPKDREYEDPLNGLNNSFSGSSRTWIADLLWKWAPNGNAKHTNLKLQGEYFRRNESGDLVYDTNNTAQQGSFRNTQSGYYAQAVYQFMPNWRIGYRYDRLSSGSANIELINNGTLMAADLPLLANYSPSRNTVMVDWSPSEFSRVRLQYAQDKTRPEATDNQLWLQYVMSLGAHGAHKF
ncbi:MAG: TonB-dependent receptor [Azonexus sp.]